VLEAIAVLLVELLEALEVLEVLEDNYIFPFFHLPIFKLIHHIKSLNCETQ
jgi:hypothetical protein